MEMPRDPARESRRWPLDGKRDQHASSHSGSTGDIVGMAGCEVGEVPRFGVGPGCCRPTITPGGSGGMRRLLLPPGAIAEGGAAWSLGRQAHAVVPAAGLGFDAQPWPARPGRWRPPRSGRRLGADQMITPLGGNQRHGICHADAHAILEDRFRSWSGRSPPRRSVALRRDVHEQLLAGSARGGSIRRVGPPVVLPQALAVAAQTARLGGLSQRLDQQLHLQSSWPNSASRVSIAAAAYSPRKRPRPRPRPREGPRGQAGTPAVFARSG